MYPDDVIDPVYKELRIDQNWIDIHRDQLHEALSNKDHKKLNDLLVNFGNFNIMNNEDMCESPLDFAANQGDDISVKLLLAHGAIPDYKRPLHFWPSSTLSQAIQGGNHKIIELLVNNGCDPDTELRFPSSRLLVSHINPCNYWYKIIELNDVPMFQLMLKCSNRVLGNDIWSQKMLLLACSLGSMALIEYLISQGVSIESSDEFGWSCVFYAIAYMNISLIQLLLDLDANFNRKDFMGHNLLHILILYHKVNNSNIENQIDVIELLIELGVDINDVNVDGLTPINMSYTVTSVNNELVMKLLSYSDIDLAKADFKNVTVLHRAVSFGGFFAVRDILYSLDVDINSRDFMGRTPLQYINSYSSVMNSLELLLEMGADTKNLGSLENTWLKHEQFLISLEEYQLKRKIANFNDDVNVNSLLTKRSVLFGSERKKLILMYSGDILRMQKTLLCDKLTYYDFLHAKKRTLIRVAKKPGMRDHFMMHKHNFFMYAHMLCKNYLSGARSLSLIELKAVNYAEYNLNVIFNNRLPNLILYNIKKYIDIEDMITLDNLNVV